MSIVHCLRAMVLSMLVLGIFACPIEGAENKAAPNAAEAAKAKKPTGRLPAHFGDVVSPEQKQKIYAIQAEYAPKLGALREQLSQLQKEQEQKIEAVLSPEQKQKIAQLKAATDAGRKAKADAKKAPAPRKAAGAKN